MSNQTLAERIDILYEARLRNPENPENELERVSTCNNYCWAPVLSLHEATACTIRLKPRTITREITYPENLRDAPEHGTELYRAAPEISSRYDLFYWHGVYYHSKWLHDGLLHSTKEAAIAHGKALAGVSDE